MCPQIFKDTKEARYSDKRLRDENEEIEMRNLKWSLNYLYL